MALITWGWQHAPPTRGDQWSEAKQKTELSNEMSNEDNMQSSIHIVMIIVITTILIKRVAIGPQSPMNLETLS